MFYSIKHILSTIENFKEKGIELISRKEGFKTSTAVGEKIVDMFSALTLFERDILIERTKNGLRNAKEKGVVLGRPKTNSSVLNTAFELYDTNKYTISEICKNLKISRATFYREKNLREKNNVR